MYQGSPKDVSLYLRRLGRKVPHGENPIEYMIDVIQGYDHSEHGVQVLRDFATTGMKPPLLTEEELSVSFMSTPTRYQVGGKEGKIGKRLHLQTISNGVDDFDHSLRSPYNTSRSWSPSGVIQTLKFTPSRKRTEQKMLNSMRYM